MTRLILAIAGSNQGNSPPALAGLTEQEHILPLATAILEAANRYPSIVARLFTATPQSEDWPAGSLSGLVAQQRAAAAWIGSIRGPGDLTVSLNLHSDSGDYRHCGYFYDPLSGPVSEWLGRALTEAIKGWFGGRVTHADYSAYAFAREARAVACPLLLEMGAHTIPADVAAVRDHAGEIAAELVIALAGFFGLETAPALNTSELRSFPEWALLRLANGEDSRDMAAFRVHLANLGADVASPLSRYGVPA